jgi:hypothetical protein
MVTSEIKRGTLHLLPPKEGLCPECATAHAPEEPHNRCLFYQMHFHGQHGRFPTWEDAWAHCTDEVKEICREALRSMGYRPDGTRIEIRQTTLDEVGA